MKKIIFLLYILAVAGVQAFAQTVSEAQARQVATHFFQSVSKLNQVQMTTVSSSVRRGGTPECYVFQPAGAAGFVLVAGTQGSTPILGYSTESNFPLTNPPPAFQYWMDEYRKSLDYIEEHRLAPTPETAQKWRELAVGELSVPENSVIVGPLLATQWDQAPLYNNACPQMAVTGCVATAMAQVMRYWNYPVGTTARFHMYQDGDCGDGVCGTFASNVGGPSYEWANMPNTLDGANSNSIYQVSKLMFDCGVSVDMNYGTNESGAYSSNIPGAMTGFFNYGPCWIDHPGNPNEASWRQGIKDQLNYTSPVLYCATGDSNGGHCWVCDGYDDHDMFHMNWGWGGSGNGWFYLDNLHPNGLDFTEDHSAVVDVRPPGCIGYYSGANVFPNGTYSGSAAHAIQINSGTVPSPIVSNVHAGDQIVLKPGFTAQSGSTFRAWIQGCNGQFTDQSEDRSGPESPAVPSSPLPLTAFPNPFSDQINLHVTLAEPGPAGLMLFDLSGRLVRSIDCPVLAESGRLEADLPTADLAPGIYLLRLQYRGGQQTVKVLKMDEK